MRNLKLPNSGNLPNIKTWAIDDVRPRHNYPKQYSARMHQQMRLTLRRYGQFMPVIVDHKGFLIDGYLTWRALKKLGFDKILVVVSKS
ncbi:MAG: hypothetical protein COB46_02155 [Rhodospirillaceae bacterium]|nr:MAG: hypothetical protein COB46_02155 [Rhodospirillaceae bacterium]